MSIDDAILLLFGASLLVTIVTSLDERRRKWLRPKATALTSGIFFGALVGGATSSLLTRYATEARFIPGLLVSRPSLWSIGCPCATSGN